ncbi:MAG: hypothetical protein JOY77_11585 [Alphaproteobacteria bacterium]|nr:hypothetical protein [Alphaproteobacteria bacterium]MBV9063551.1 hypothetical protein [Alphaproteobacteria bacterium]
MILRAIFWIGLVAILMPHEPNVGLGSPRASGLVETIKAAALHRLIELRAELLEAEQARGKSAVSVGPAPG